jgi:prolyl-tRNA synthetase
MRLSQYGWVTYKEVPKDAVIPSHQLLMRAGLIHKSANGLYNYMPMAVRTLRKIENIIREELNLINAHEILMSMVTPGELWKETGRWDIMGGQMAKFKDRADKDLCLSPTNEETVTDIFRKTIHSYKQLPLCFYQINTKFRDEIRPRYGLLRGREFSMKDGYSFHLTKPCLDDFYHKMFGSYSAIFKRMGLDFIAVEADGGNMAASDSKTHEFQIIADTGEDTLVYEPITKFAANIEKSFTLAQTKFFTMASEALEEIETPLVESTMDAVAKFCQVDLEQCLKAVVFKVLKNKIPSYVVTFVRGNDDINETKLKNFLAADDLITATDYELLKLELVKGFIGPMDLPPTISVHFDLAVDPKHAYIVGANKINKHLKNFHLGLLDKNHFNAADLRLSRDGDKLPTGEIIQLKKGIEAGHIFQLGDKYTKAMNVTVLDQAGKHATPLMGCYGIGVTRLIAAAIEQHHDEAGIKWPSSIAPYEVYLCRIAKSPEVKLAADALYETLLKENIEVLYDDRDLSPGGMFKDSDLLGLPYRVLVSEKDFLAGSMIEVKIRSNGEVLKINKSELVSWLKNKISQGI